MSELKAFTFGLGQKLKDGSPCVVAFDDEKNPRLASDEKFYIKSEADKVFAELKQKINEAQTELELWRDGSIISETHQKELDEKRHSDYKRCLAMAKWCHDKWNMSLGWDRADGYTADFFLHYQKWEKRWLKIAEKFKVEGASPV